MANPLSEKHKRVVEVSEAISKMAHGTTLTHIALAEILGEQAKTNGYYSMVRRVRRELMQKYAVFLDTTVKVGYSITLPGHEINILNAKCDRSVKQYVRAVKDMNYIDIDKIKDDTLKQRTIRIAQEKANLAGMMRLGMQQQRLEGTG